jgi:hypothetical protein
LNGVMVVRVRGRGHPRGMPLVTRMQELQASRRGNTWHRRVQISVENAHRTRSAVVASTVAEAANLRLAAAAVGEMPQLCKLYVIFWCVNACNSEAGAALNMRPGAAVVNVNGLGQSTALNPLCLQCCDIFEGETVRIQQPDKCAIGSHVCVFQPQQLWGPI